MKKICRICGQQFESRGTRSVCYSDHHHPCPVCGKDVLCNDPNTKKFQIKLIPFIKGSLSFFNQHTNIKLDNSAPLPVVIP